MSDMIELAAKGIRHKAGAYLALTMLVTCTVAGYLVVSSYWKDAGRIATASAEPLNFPYLKATVLFAYWSNPPISADEEFPPPRIYEPVFNDRHLREVSSIPGVLDLSVALSQDAFTRFGSAELLSIEEGAPLWGTFRLVSGRLPQDTTEVLVPKAWAEAGAVVGQTLIIRVPRSIMPREYRVDGRLVYPPNPEPEKMVTISGVYEPFSSMISGPVGFIKKNRVAAYPEPNPREVTMAWPVPNTIFLRLADPSKAESVLSSWTGMYRDYPGAEPPLIPPVKVAWMPDLPAVMVQLATAEVATPMVANTANAFALGAIGIFASMFLSFLDRRRDLGILKTVGFDNSHTAGTISLEIVFAGAVGTVLGILGAYGITGHFLRGISGNSIAIPWSSLGAGFFVSCSLLIAATYVPRAMARQGTVMELLYGRPIPIYRRRVS